ncbi:hypothetical protein ANCCAN_04430 [Ancylostoma caninum]|uniref:CUE domain-containing protein n=1 Tax=Ancylostoma caninum TaxID=29170 RepID=A0A368H1J9_ANCCA|nr:hypothetical protein ANCCAN_04430 [Ancylostoma caninum]
MCKIYVFQPRQASYKNSKNYLFNTTIKPGLVMDYEATVKYLKCLFPKVSSEELCWAYIESDGDIDRAAGLILDGQYIAVKLQRAQDALHRHETDEAKECSANKSLATECPSEGSSIYEDVPESPGSRFVKAKQNAGNSGSSSYHSLPCGGSSLGSVKYFERDGSQFDDLRSKASQSKTSVPSSLPDLVSEGSDSYTDVTSRHSCDGAANSLSGTIESTASVSTPSYVCNEAHTKTTEYRRKGDLELSIKFVMPAHMGPTALARGILARVLLQSGCNRFELKRVDPTPRAEYEEQASEYWYFITLTPASDEEHDEMIVHFVERLCYFVGGGFHDQILAEFPEIKVIFGEVRQVYRTFSTEICCD